MLAPSISTTSKPFEFSNINRLSIVYAFPCKDPLGSRCLSSRNAKQASIIARNQINKLDDPYCLQLLTHLSWFQTKIKCWKHSQGCLPSFLITMICACYCNPKSAKSSGQSLCWRSSKCISACVLVFFKNCSSCIKKSLATNSTCHGVLQVKANVLVLLSFSRKSNSLFD